MRSSSVQYEILNNELLHHSSMREQTDARYGRAVAAVDRPGTRLDLRRRRVYSAFVNIAADADMRSRLGVKSMLRRCEDD
jgi:hypothetical protein